MCWGEQPPRPSCSEAGSDPPGGTTTGCPRGHLAVRVVHDTTGAPIGQAQVTVTGLGTRDTNADGWAEWRDLRVGSYDVSGRKRAHTPDPARRPGVVVVANQTTRVELRLLPLELHLHVDNDRDGTVNDDWENNARWEPGRGRKGAVVRVNNDDEDRDRDTDWENDHVDTATDVPDIAPLIVRKRPAGATFPADWYATLSADKPDRLRIFDRRAAGGNEIIGPSQGAAFDITDLTPDEHRFGMEGTGYPDAGFDGRVTLTLRLFDGRRAELHSETAIVRVSPWMIFHHALATTRVYVVETADNAQFRSDLAAAIGGVPLQAAPQATWGGDRWMQDAMEPGFSSLPQTTAPDTWSLPVTLRTYNDRALGWTGGIIDQYPRNVLLGPGYGFTQAAPPGDGSSLDSFGNLECSPPFRHTARGRDYPFGRMVYGGGGREMAAEVRDFLQQQRVQEPFEINTNWLVVGHVDEAISFLPLPSAPKGFKVLTASPRLALDIVRRVPNAARLLQGIHLPPGTTRARIDARYPMQTAGAIKANAAFRGYQATVQGHMNGIKNRLKAELDLQDSDFIDLPVLFDRETPPPRFIAYTPDVVNMLVVTASPASLRLCVPKPFGPLVGGICQFEQEVRNRLTFPGITITFVDDFTTYHMRAGEIHCGTNSQRTPPGDRWWWEVDWL